MSHFNLSSQVDSFSFGMFIYELLSLHQPFAGSESVKELVLEGGRPPLTPRELVYPTYVLDLMVRAWAQQPRERPSASQLVSIASAPEFVHLVDAAALDSGVCAAAAVVPRKNCSSTAPATGKGKGKQPSSAVSSTTEVWIAQSSAFEDFPELHLLEVNKCGWQVR